MSEDHANARKLAEGLASIKGVELQGEIQTNIVRFRIKGKEASPIVANLKEQGILVIATGPDSIRAVTHLEITSADICNVLQRFATFI